MIFLRNILNVLSDLIGWFLTLLWLGLIGFIVHLKWSDVLEMSLSEVGGFLSGVTAPLAFIWLIVGYTLQRKELKANTEALRLQQIEIKKQAAEMVKQTKHLDKSAQAHELQSTMSILNS